MAKDYQTLVNADNVRAAVKRAFSGSPASVVGELLQNSQRAGARNVKATVTFPKDAADQTPPSFSYEDDGHGLRNGLDDLHAFLSMGDSGWDERVAQQEPIGLGVNALLAMDVVALVTVESAGMRLEIDPARWWRDREYYTSWASRVGEAEARPGLRLEVEFLPGAAGNSVAQQFRNCFDGGGIYPGAYGSRRGDVVTPACGYTREFFDTLTINGREALRGLPESFDQPPLAEGTFGGARLRVWQGERSTYQTTSLVDWYGQLVKCKTLVPGFRFLLTVRSGRPVTPRSPVRDEIVEDEALRELKKAVEDLVFSTVPPEGGKPPEAIMLDAYFRANPERARAECQWMLASPAWDCPEAKLHVVVPRRGEGSPSVVLSSDGDVVDKDGDVVFSFVLDEELVLDLGLPEGTYFARTVGGAGYLGAKPKAYLQVTTSGEEFFTYQEAEFHERGEWRVAFPDGEDEDATTFSEWREFKSPFWAIRDSIHFYMFGDETSVVVLPGKDVGSFLDEHGDDVKDGDGQSNTEEGDYEENYDESLEDARKKWLGPDAVSASPDLDELRDALRRVGGKYDEKLVFVELVYGDLDYRPRVYVVTGDKGTVARLRTCR